MSAADRFASIVWGALAEADRLPVAEHARLAHRAGGPSLEELEKRIRAHRARGIPLAA